VTEQDAYNELQAYTLAHRDPAFIHQHVVDAWSAQHANEHSKPIGVTFALVGLFLHVEKGWSGRQVQRAHSRLARHKHSWPSFPLPATRGGVTAIDVIEAPPGPERDRAIDGWCASVWTAFDASHTAVADLLRERGIL
jgi:hypothetical protein